MKQKIIIGIFLCFALIVGLVYADANVFASDDLAALYLGVGSYHYDNGDYETALEFFEKAILEDPGRVEAHHNRGVALHALSRNQEAIASFKDAVALDPNYAASSYSLGLIYFGLGEYTSAINHFVKTAELEPDKPNVLFDTAVAYVERFRSKEATGIAREDLSDLYAGHSYYLSVVQLEGAFPHAQENADIVAAVIAEYEEALG